MTSEHQRAWVAEICFPGKKPCWFGTVICRLGATHQEVEEAVREKALECLPDGFDIVKLCPGMLLLQLDDEEDDPASGVT